MACGALIAATAFYGSSPVDYVLLAAALATGIFSVYFGVRRAASYLVLGLLGGCLSCYVNRVPDIPRTLINGDKANFNIELMRVSEGPKGLICLGKALGAHGRDCPAFRVYLTVTDRALVLSPGDVINVNARTDDVFHTSEIPFMQTEALAARCDGVTARMLASSDDISIIGASDALRYRLLRLRDRLALAVHSADLSPQVSSLIASVCLGTADTPVSVKDSFRVAGIAHLLCVSGFHVGFVAWLVACLLWPLRLWSHVGRIRYPIIILAVWFYVGIIGFSPSAIRAAIMLTTYYIGRILQRGSSGLNSLALAVAVMLLVQPRWLWSVGMQLSVCAVLGILLFARRLNPVAMRHRALYRMFELFTVPLSATIATVPVILFWFHRLPLLTVITNAFATLLFVPFMAIGCLAVLLDSFGVPTGLLASVLVRIYNMLIHVCDFSTAGTILSGIYLTYFKLLLIVAGIALLTLVLHATNRKLRIAAGVCILVVAGFSGCGEAPKAGNELIVAGNNKATQLLIRHGNNGYTMSISNMPCNFAHLNDYFGGYGIEPDSITKNPSAESLKIDGLAIATRSKKYRLIRPADYLIVDGTFNSDIKEILTAVKPKFVVLCANLPVTMRQQWESACKAAGATVMPLGDKALRIKL